MHCYSLYLCFIPWSISYSRSFKYHLHSLLGFPDSSVSKESTCNAGDPSSIPGSGRSTREGIGYPLQNSWTSLEAQLLKNSPAMWFNPWVHRRIDAFELWCWRRLLRVPWTTRRSNQSILKTISPEYSLEGLMLKLKLQYFGLLVRRADSLEKTLMLGKIERKRRRG